MENPKIIEIIANLKGRRNYEEKKASKLGFSSLYDYFEDKIATEGQKKEGKENSKASKKAPQKPKPKPQFEDNCGCC